MNGKKAAAATLVVVAVAAMALAYTAWCNAYRAVRGCLNEAFGEVTNGFAESARAQGKTMKVVYEKTTEAALKNLDQEACK